MLYGVYDLNYKETCVGIFNGFKELQSYFGTDFKHSDLNELMKNPKVIDNKKYKIFKI